MQTLRQDAQAIIDKALADALPDSAVRRALEQFQKPEGRLVLIAAGKAAWQMAKAAYDVLGTAITSGAVITKYDHVKGPIGALELFEAGHPVPDENGFAATRKALASSLLPAPMLLIIGTPFSWHFITSSIFAVTVSTASTT